MAHINTRYFSIILTLACCAMSLTQPAFAATGGTNTGDTDANANDTSTTTYPRHDVLVDPKRETRQGKRTMTGCAFDFPVLRLGPNEKAVVAQPLEVNHDTCSVTWEIGEPFDYDSVAGELTATDGGTAAGGAAMSKREPEGVRDDETASIMASQSTSASYVVRWHDVVHLTVNRLQSNMYWVYNGSAITASSGSWSDYYAGGTGWSRLVAPTAIHYNGGSWKQYVRTKGSYKNYTFCAPVDVRTYYEYVRVIGYGNGAKDGYVDSTWTTETPEADAWSCPNLHPHMALVSPAP